MRTFSFQRIGEYKASDQAKTLAERDYKDATDLILRGGCHNMNENEGGDGMNGEKTVVRRLTPL